MAVLSGLEPKAVFEYFEKLCAVPHGSHNTKQISDLCVSFARELGLPVKFVGLGEGVEDLQPFDAQEFVQALI